MTGPEQIKPYDKSTDKGAQVEQMFDSIAPAYDFMNTAMTFGLHRHWRNKALAGLMQSLEGVAVPHVLDLACGTGDVALHLASLHSAALITGADLSEGMLAVARRKLAKEHKDLQRRIRFCQADALKMPFPDGEFDAMTIAYGVRNFENLKAGYTEMRRVLKPGGILCVIELCEPKNPLLRLGYKFYSRCLIPLAGRAVSHDSRAYSYLPQSIAACPSRTEMTDLLQATGFTDASYRILAPGVCGIYTARATSPSAH